MESTTSGRSWATKYRLRMWRSLRQCVFKFPRYRCTTNTYNTRNAGKDGCIRAQYGRVRCRTSGYDLADMRYSSAADKLGDCCIGQKVTVDASLCSLATNYGDGCCPLSFFLLPPHGMFLINWFLVICGGRRRHRALSVQLKNALGRCRGRPFYITVRYVHSGVPVTICSITNVVIISPTSACVLHPPPHPQSAPAPPVHRRAARAARLATEAL